MKIQPISNNNVSAPSPRVAADAAQEKPAKADIIIHGRLASLSDAMSTVPSIRPDAVAIGRSLAADPNYPGPIVLDRLASMFVADVMATSRK